MFFWNTVYVDRDQRVTTKLYRQPNDNTKKPKQQLMKTANVYKTKPDGTKAWLRSAFMPSSREMTGLILQLQLPWTTHGSRLGFSCGSQ